jgi:hypothetical protein
MRREVIAAFLLLASCNEAPTYILLQLPAVPDGGVLPRDASMPPPRDAGPRDTGVAFDAGPLPPSDRTLTTHRILGESPLENLVLNPQLDLHTTLTLFGFSGLGRRHHFTSSPSGLAVLEIGQNDGAVIPVQSRAVPLDASVWLGRDGSEPVAATALLTGLSRSGGVRVANLTRDPASREQHGNIVWQRFAGSVTESFLGQVQLVIESGIGGPLYATGPIVVPRLSGVRGPSFPTVELEPIDERLREKLEAVFARAREQAKRSIRQRDPLPRR